MSRVFLIILVTFSRLLSLVPYRALMALGTGMGFALYRWLGFRTDVVRENLRIAFGDTLPEARREKLIRENYEHYGRALFDFLLSIGWTTRQFRRHVPVHGIEHLRSALAEGRGAYLLSCHLGSWELAIGAVAAHGIPLDVVVKHARSRVLEDFLQWYRRKTGAGIFLESRTHHEILKSLSRGRAVGFIMDQFMGPPIGLPVTFFNATAGTAVSLALMLERKPAPVVPVHAYRGSDGRVHTRFEAPLTLPARSRDRTQRLYERTQLFNDTLETLVRRHPAQWLWLHRRWKPYRGEPRWKPVSVSVSLAFAFLVGLAGCGYLEVSSKTGIELPPDPEVEAPVVVSSPAEEPTPEERARQMEHARKLGIVVAKGSPKSASASRPAVKKAPPARKAAAKAKESDAYKVVPVKRVPFQLGERMVLELTWMALPAGKATLEVSEGQKFGGRDTYLLKGNVLSSRLVDTIYHVDNTVETFVDRAALIPYKFLLHMVESKQLKETKVVFDHSRGKAHYWSKRISEKWGNEVLNNKDEFRSGSKDMWSALYYARTLDFKLNRTERFPVYEKGKTFDILVTPVANEVVRTGVGIFQAWKLDVKVKLDNHLRQTGDVFLWISDDSNRYIVKFDAKIKIGSLKGNLIELRERSLAGQ